MSIQDVIKKYWNKLEMPKDEKFTSDVEDRQLTSLERMRNAQLNEIRKRQLKDAIKRYNKTEESKNVWGFKHEPKKSILERYKKDKSIGYDKRPILKEKNRFKNGGNILKCKNILSRR